MAAAYSLFGSWRGPYTLKKRRPTHSRPYARVYVCAYSSHAIFCAACGEMGRGSISSSLGCSGASPYAAHEQARTTRATFDRRAVSRTWTVPPTLTAVVRSGSAIETGTEGMAARWNTQRAPVTAC